MPKVTAEHLEARKNQILEAATACFARKGFHRTTMQDICRESGLSPGAIYRYFRSKEDIVESAGELERDQVMDIIRQVGERVETLKVLDALAQHFFGMLASIGDGAPVHLDLSAECLRDPRLFDIMQRNYRVYLEALTSIVRQGIAEGKFNPNLDPKSAAQVMIAMYEGTEIQKTLFPDEVDIGKLLQVVHSLVAGEFWRGSSSDRPTAGVGGEKLEG